MSEQKSLIALQVVFGAILVVLGMLMLSWMYSENIVLVYIAVALLCFKDGLMQLAAAFLEITGKGE